MFEIPIFNTISLGPLTLQVWGLFVSLGVLAAYALARPRWQRAGLPENRLDNLIGLALLSALLGARLLWVMIEPEFYLANPVEIFKFWRGGLAFAGGLIAALVTVSWYLRKHKIGFWQAADALAAPLAAGLLVGRFGCLFTGLHPGLPIDFGAITTVDGITRLAWPAVAILNWAIALVALFWLEKRKLAIGTLAKIMLAWWALWRFLGDFLRADADIMGGDPRYGLLTPTQYLALAVLLVTLFLLFNRSDTRELT